MKIKTYVVSPVDGQGVIAGEPIAAKLTRGAAQAVAKKNAPCRITTLWADKSDQQQP